MELRISRTSLTTILRHKPVPTQEISPCSPASTSDLSDSNSSTSSPTSSSSSHSSFDQAEQAEQQLKPLKLATWETENDILYTNECFPTKYGYYMDNPYAAEPIELAEGARIKIVDEISDRMARVEELDTGKRGLVPQYILEDPLERLARLNTIDNEISLCHVETSAQADATPSGTSKYRHQHSMCLQQNIRDRVREMRKEQQSKSGSDPVRAHLLPRFNNQKVNFKEPNEDSESECVYRYANPVAPGPKVIIRRGYWSEPDKSVEPEIDPNPCWDEGWYETPTHLKIERKAKSKPAEISIPTPTPPRKRDRIFSLVL